MRNAEVSVAELPTHEHDELVLNSPSLTVTAAHRGTSSADARVVRVRGDVDMMTAPQLHEALRRQLRGADRAVLDLSDVEFLGTAGVEVLLRLNGQVRLALVARRGPALRALAVTGADEEIALHATLVDAELSQSESALPAAP